MIGLIHHTDRGFEFQLVPPDIPSKALKRRKRKMTTQKYKDLTYLFGPPSGDRYDRLVEKAQASGQSFSDIYGSYIRDLVTNFEEDVFDRVFSSTVLTITTQYKDASPFELGRLPGTTTE